MEEHQRQLSDREVSYLSLESHFQVIVVIPGILQGLFESRHLPNEYLLSF